MNPCPAGPGDYIEFLAEQDILMALSMSLSLSLSLRLSPVSLFLAKIEQQTLRNSRDYQAGHHYECFLFETRHANRKLSCFCAGTCPGGDLSLWGFGAASEKEMVKCCRPLKVEVFHLQDTDLLKRGGWKPAEPSTYRGMHGMMVPEGEHQAKS